MTKTEYVEFIFKAFKANGLIEMLDNEKAEKFFELYSFLVEYNKTTNLTAITEEKEVILKHFIDCAAITPYIEPNASVIDVGCGAGFPSLPIAIVRPDISVVSLDSTGKKIDFVNQAIKHLSLSRSTAICARAEEYAKDHRELFDVCTSRAVARLNILAELCLPLVNVGGSFIAMKSGKGAEELSEADGCISKLGGAKSPTVSSALYVDGCEKIDREIQIIKKVKPTANQYPRKYAQILKKPL